MASEGAQEADSWPTASGDDLGDAIPNRWEMIGVPLFQYEPLLEGEIRLIKIETRIPMLHITHYPITETPKYVALSYRWGSEQREEPLLANSQVLKVTTQLIETLGNLAPLLSEWDCPIWVDQICINQEDIAEKSAQVGMMKSIYERAWDICAWLGTGTEASHRALERLQALTSPVETNAIDHVINHLLKNDEDDFATLEGLAAFLLSEWWQRIWIVQEASANTSLKLLYGESRLYWKDIVGFFMVVFWMIPLVRDRNPSKLPNLITPYLKRLVGIRRHRGDGTLPTLLELLHDFQVYEATDARDKVYALLGISSDFSDSLELRPNYSLTVEEVFIKTATEIIMQEPDPLRKLDILGCCSGSERLPGLPSWVPDWRSAAVCQRIPFVKTLKGKDGNVVAAYNAGEENPQVIDISGRTLTIKGFFLDYIDEVGEGINKNTQHNKATYESWLSIVGLKKEPSLDGLFGQAESDSDTEEDRDDLNPRYISGETTYEAFLRTLVADMAWDYGVPDERGHAIMGLSEVPTTGSDLTVVPREIPSEFSNLKILESLRDWTQLVPYNCIRRREGWVMDDNMGYRLNDTAVALRAATLGRRFARTGKNDLMCLVPADARENDLLFFAAGAPVPYCIRPGDHSESILDGTFELIGESYVHGAMDGEFGVEESGLQSVRIT